MIPPVSSTHLPIPGLNLFATTPEEHLVPTSSWNKSTTHHQANLTKYVVQECVCHSNPNQGGTLSLPRLQIGSASLTWTRLIFLLPRTNIPLHVWSCFLVYDGYTEELYNNKERRNEDCFPANQTAVESGDDKNNVHRTHSALSL